jgi:hypothetical protein
MRGMERGQYRGLNRNSSETENLNSADVVNGLSGVTSRLIDDRLAALGQTVRGVAADLTVALGGVMPEAKSFERSHDIWLSLRADVLIIRACLAGFLDVRPDSGSDLKLRCNEMTRWAIPEIAPSHSITSSAVDSRDGGTVMPSALAVLRLITSSNLVGCSMGRSPGLVPCRILST